MPPCSFRAAHPWKLVRFAARLAVQARTRSKGPAAQIRGPRSSLPPRSTPRRMAGWRSTVVPRSRSGGTHTENVKVLNDFADNGLYTGTLAIATGATFTGKVFDCHSAA